MAALRAASLDRGSPDANRRVAADRRTSRASYLTPVDEEMLDQEQVAAYHDEASGLDVWASAPDFSSDEETENRHRQSTAARRQTEVSGAEPWGKSASCRARVVPQRVSTRPSSRSAILQRSACEIQFVAPPLNERKQKKLVALFYWRRKTLQTYFIAWRSLLQLESGRFHDQQQQELALLRQYRPAYQGPALRKSSHHSSTLLRNALQRHRRDSVVSAGPVSSHRRRMDSLRDEYRLLKSTNRMSEEPRVQPIEPRVREVDGEVTKRSELRDRLRLYYLWFEGWRDFVSGRRQEETRHDQLAHQTFQSRCMRKHFRAWTTCFLTVCRNRRQRWLSACEWSDQVATRRLFRAWTQWLKRRRGLETRLARLVQVRARLAVIKWHQWTKRTARLDGVAWWRQYLVLRRYFLRLQRNLLHCREKNEQQKLADLQSRRQLAKRTWLQWTGSVCNNEDAARFQKCATQLSYSSAVNKWKRFVARRRDHHTSAVQADHCLYEGLLRRFWTRWRRFLCLKEARRGVGEQASTHWSTRCKRQAIQALLSNRCMRQYGQNQARGASEYFARRCVQNRWQQWKKHTDASRRCRRFRMTRIKRTFVLCFAVWQQLTRRSSRLSSLYTTLAVQERHRKLSASIFKWRYAYRFQYAFRVVSARHIRQKMEQTWIHWRDAAAQRRQWDAVVHRATSTRALKLRRRVFVAWCRLTIGTRCRRRLVQLFQKKQLSKNLRLCFRAMALQANVHRLILAKQKRCLESAWHSWVTFRCDQQSQMNATNAAVAFYSLRRYANAIELWRQNSQRSTKRRCLNAKAIRHLVVRIMRGALHVWCRSVSTRKRQRVLVETQTAKRSIVLLSKSLVTWYSAARVRRRKCVKIHRLWCQAMARRRERTFFAWRSFVNHRNARYQLIAAAKCASQRQRGRRYLRAWRTIAFQLEQCRIASDTIVSRRRLHTMWSVVTEWRVVANRLRQNRLQELKAVTFHREFLLLWSFYGWQHATLESQVQREKQRRAVNAICRKRAQRAVSTWQTKLADRRDRENRLIRAKTFHTDRRCRQGVQMWQQFVDSRCEHRSESHKVVTFAAAKLLRRVFRSWLQFTSSTRTFKRKLRAIFQTGESDIQRKVFGCWRRYRRGSTLVWRADQWRMRWQTRAIWRLWRAQVVFTRKMKLNVLITSRLLQNNLSRARFTLWKQFVIGRQQLRLAVRRGDQHHIERSYLTAIRRLRIHVRQARAVELSATFLATHLVRQFFSVWRCGLAARKRRRQFCAFLVAKATTMQLNKAFNGWNTLVLMKRRRLEAKSELFYSQLAVNHAWQAWRRFLIRRRLMDDAIARLLARGLRRSVRQWHTFARLEGQLRHQVDAAVAHVDRVIKQKLWESWRAFIGRRRATHRLGAIAESFYSAGVLQRRHLQLWYKYVTYRRIYHSQQQQADTQWMLTTMRKCFDSLESYVAHRYMRTGDLRVENDAIRSLLLRRSVSKWHSQASIHNTLVQARTRAIKFHRERLQALAIASLLTNSKRKQQQHAQRLRATASRRRLLCQQHVARWIRFVAWRHRHKNLLRLFRSNQQSDFFAVWRRYVQRCQHKRSLQVTATQGYRILIQRRAFARWVERGRYWRDKHRTDVWYNSRMRRRVFEVWLRRARVLRKMRQAFRFQDSFRLETHFQSWKCLWRNKKQQLARLQHASVWFTRHRHAKCFVLWTRWLASKRQDKATLRMAVGFRKRFFSRKYLRAWRGVVAWTKRKALLTIEAKVRYTQTTHRSCFSQLAAYASVKRAGRDKSAHVVAAIQERRVARSIWVWRRRVGYRRADQSRHVTAQSCYHRTLLQRCWSHLCNVLNERRAKHCQRTRAYVHYEAAISRQVLVAWSEHTKQRRRLGRALQRVKQRFFCNVSDDYFVRWKAFVVFKRKLRSVKLNIQRASQLRILTQWRKHTSAQRSLAAAVGEFNSQRNCRIVRQCVSHWERVATDRWIHANLIHASHQRRALQQKRKVLTACKSMLRLRHARQAWRERARNRHRDRLAEMLHRWRQISMALASEAGQDEFNSAS